MNWLERSGPRWHFGQGLLRVGKIILQGVGGITLLVGLVWGLSKARAFHGVYSQLVSTLKDEPVLVVVLGLGVLLLILWWVPKRQVSTTISDSEKRLQLENASRATLAQMVGGTAFIITAFFSWKTIVVTQEGQITDRYTKAIEQLADDKHVHVRLGGIYALERISKDSPRDLQTITDVLTTYVRDKAPYDPQHPKEIRPAPDIQAILMVLGRRHPPSSGFGILDLRGTDLTGVDLDFADLPGVNFAGANLTEASFYYAGLSEAHLAYAHLTGANLAFADLSGAVLAFADLTKADLDGANLKGVIGLEDAKGLTQDQLNQAENVPEITLRRTRQGPALPAPHKAPAPTPGRRRGKAS